MVERLPRATFETTALAQHHGKHGKLAYSVLLYYLMLFNTAKMANKQNDPRFPATKTPLGVSSATPTVSKFI